MLTVHSAYPLHFSATVLTHVGRRSYICCVNSCKGSTFFLVRAQSFEVRPIRGLKIPCLLAHWTHPLTLERETWPLFPPVRCHGMVLMVSMAVIEWDLIKQLAALALQKLSKDLTEIGGHLAFAPVGLILFPCCHKFLEGKIRTKLKGTVYCFKL